MNNCVLFSPIGSSDPIRGEYDGSMLHIVRHYRPRKVYLYYSEEMKSRDDVDNKCEEAIHYLNAAIKVKKITSAQEILPNDFNAYIGEFSRILHYIYQENPESIILLNISSGTPQMKSTLCLEVISSNIKMIPVQVSTPEFRANKSKTVTEESMKSQDMMDLFDYNLDNLLESENRCSEPDIFSFRRTMIKSQIEALIKIYDYRGALGFAEELGNEMVVKLIQHCDLRLNMNYIQAQKTIREYRGTPIEHINDVKCRELVEYYLSLKIKQRKANLTDFVIGFNPFLVEFMQQYIEVIQGKRLDVVLECKHKTKEYVVSRQKLEMYYKNFLLYLDKEFNVYRDSSVNIAFLYHFIVYHADQKKEFQEVNLFGKLKEMNQELRNKAAHQFSFINDQDIKEVTGMTSNQILIGIEKLFIKIYSNKIKSKVFQVYDLMNEFIVEELNVY